MSAQAERFAPKPRCFRDRLRVVIWTKLDTNRVEFISLRTAALRYGSTTQIPSYRHSLETLGYCFITEKVMVNV